MGEKHAGRLSGDPLPASFLLLETMMISSGMSSLDVGVHPLTLSIQRFVTDRGDVKPPMDSFGESTAVAHDIMPESSEFQFVS